MMKRLGRFRVRLSAHGVRGKAVAAIAVAAALVLVLTAAFLTVPAPAQAAAPTQVRFGVDAFILGAQIHVAEERGLFKKYGIDPEVQVFSYGSDTLDAVLAGRSDFGVALDFATLTRLPAGQLRIVAAIMEPSPGFHKLAVRSGINGPEDLKGKRIGVAQGTLQHYVTLRYLNVNHIPTDSVKITPFSSLFEIVGALRAGRIDAAWVWGNGTDQAKEIPGVKILTDDSAARNQSTGYLVVSRQLLDRNPAAVKGTLQALAEATDWMVKNMDDASKIVAARVKAPQAEVLTEMKRENYTFGLKTSQLETLDNLEEFMVTNGILKKALAVRTYVDFAPLREVAPGRVAF